MIWSSAPLMITIDLIIVGMVAVIIFYVLRIRGFRYGHSMSPGRWLLLGGIFVTAAFYLADLIIMTAVPSILGDARAATMMDTLHREARWPVSMMSVAMISAGIFLLLGQRRRLESRVRESEDLLRAVRHSSDRSESRFRSIIEQTPYSIYCFEFDPPARITGDAREVIAASHDAVLIECNRVFAVVSNEGARPVQGEIFYHLDHSTGANFRRQYRVDFGVA